MPAGLTSPGWRPPTPSTGPLTRPKGPVIRTPQQAYPASIEQTGQDYDEIMNRYRSMLDKGPDSERQGLMQKYQSILSGASSGATPYTPRTLAYQRTPEVSGALGTLGELATTGGYSTGDISNIRERGISPIRSVYANAMQNLNRQRSLQGGYSPGYGATTARMSRDLSEQLAGTTTNVNAQIAQMVAQGRMQAAPQYAQFAGQEAGAQRDIDRTNLEAEMRGREFGERTGLERGQLGLEAIRGMESLRSEDTRRQMAATEGMRGLYGTTPALAELFGRQAQGQEQLEEQRASRRQAGGGMLINAYQRGMPSGYRPRFG
jgi:hypothetical protein